jgi:hypothetical protein
MLAPAPHDGASQSRGDDGCQGGQRILRGAPGWPAAPGERSPAPRSPAQARSPRTTDGFASSFASNRVSSRPSRSVPACRARGSRQRERPWRRATRRACLRVDRAAEAAWLADRPRAEVDDELVESRAAPLAARPRFLTSSSTVTATTPRACRGTPRSSGATASSPPSRRSRSIPVRPARRCVCSPLASARRSTTSSMRSRARCSTSCARRARPTRADPVRGLLRDGGRHPAVPVSARLACPLDRLALTSSESCGRRSTGPWLWIDAFGALDGDGPLEDRCRSRAGLRNQGWKDSPDGIVDETRRPLAVPSRSSEWRVPASTCCSNESPSALGASRSPTSRSMATSKSSSRPFTPASRRVAGTLEVGRCGTVNGRC